MKKKKRREKGKGNRHTKKVRRVSFTKATQGTVEKGDSDQLADAQQAGGHGILPELPECLHTQP